VSDQLLSILKFFFIALVWLFFLRVTRAAWVQVRHSQREIQPAEAAAWRGRPARSGSPESGDVAALRLKVIEPEQRRGMTFEVDGEVTIGRAPGCRIRLSEDSFASHIHARVFLKDGKPYLEDLGSTNGTWLNSRRLDGPALIKRGDKIQVGVTVLEVTR
jgi:pSer/pThr/pTyr-binding forkhead associated (FHA) protein